MNWLTLAALLLWALIVFRSFRRGFVKTFFSMIFLILVIICTVSLTPYVQKALSENETVSEWTEEQCRNYIDSKADADSSGNGTQDAAAYAWLSIIPLPDNLKENLAQGNEEIIRLLLQSDTVRSYLSEKMAAAAIGVAAFLLTLILSAIVLAVIGAILNRIANLPVLGTVNRILGLLLGICKCFLITWIIFAVIGLFPSTPAGAELLSQIKGSLLLKPMYENNLLVQFLPDVLESIL